MLKQETSELVIPGFDNPPQAARIRPWTVQALEIVDRSSFLKNWACEIKALMSNHEEMERLDSWERSGETSGCI